MKKRLSVPTALIPSSWSRVRVGTSLGLILEYFLGVGASLRGESLSCLSSDCVACFWPDTTSQSCLSSYLVRSNSVCWSSIGSGLEAPTGPSSRSISEKSMMLILPFSIFNKLFKTAQEINRVGEASDWAWPQVVHQSLWDTRALHRRRQTGARDTRALHRRRQTGALPGLPSKSIIIILHIVYI